ncbi:alpha/beta fold hydrolase [Brevibacillus sp. SIMBA_040]|uniref:alpha/beta fold hydrolase n=1 Tax=unclassified Brevibacillus TaxID=2684853 RepID=UPI003979C609
MGLGNNHIHYEICGNGYPLVILHGLGTDHRSMKAWVEPLFEKRSGWQRIYMDLPAHGHSSTPDWVKTSDDLLELLLHCIDTLLHDQHFSLIGKSFGGYLAQGILAKRAQLIDGVSLLAPALHKKERTLPTRAVLQSDEQLLSSFDADIRAAFEALMILQTKQNLDAFLSEVQPGRLLANRDFLTSDWRTNGYFFSVEPFAEGSTYPQPSLFLLGRQDAVCGYHDHRELLEHFPHSTFSILDRAGHMLEIEQRNVVLAQLEEWLNRVNLYKSMMG